MITENDEMSFIHAVLSISSKSYHKHELCMFKHVLFSFHKSAHNLFQTGPFSHMYVLNVCQFGKYSQLFTEKHE